MSEPVPLCGRCKAPLDTLQVVEFLLVPVTSTRSWQAASPDGDNIALFWHDDGSTPQAGKPHGYSQDHEPLYRCPGCQGDFYGLSHEDDGTISAHWIDDGYDQVIDLPDELKMQTKL